MKNKNFTTAGLAFNIWILTALILSAVIAIWIDASLSDFTAGPIIFIGIAAIAFSSPAFVGMIIVMPIIRKQERKSWYVKIFLLLAFCLGIVFPYGLLGASFSLLSFDGNKESYALNLLGITALLFGCAMVAVFLQLRGLYYYFNQNIAEGLSYAQIFAALFNYTSKKQHKMEQQLQQHDAVSQQPNRILIKGLVTGGLILLLLIPTLFIRNLVTEREARQKEVVKEVSSKWATSQTLSGPFLVVPYTDSIAGSADKSVATKTRLLLLANDLNVNGTIIPEQRPRSIYKVLLYKTQLNLEGNFKISWPADINPSAVDLSNARLCFSLNDFKGIEEEIVINLNGQKLLLTPGLPINDVGTVGVSAPVDLTPEMLSTGITFSMKIKIKGSEQLHFVPLSANSRFQLNSRWPSPSFDGDMLPSERTVNDSGFTARWNFNQANLPYSTVMRQNTITGKTMAFGVSLVQPADQYNKTMRSAKYAILFIGLTFAFFFIIELMQKKPFHPVQYVLVGLALIIFYVLLLSISEYIIFDHAYFIASFATILLISLYAQGHFRSWKTAGIFFFMLSCLYSFIFVLIRLEDTALLVGSIGLFIVLALVMFASRKINWYGRVQETF